MKKIAVLLIVALFFVGASYAIDANTNLAYKKGVLGTFSKGEVTVDGKTTAFAVSSNLNEFPQFLTVDLGAPIYVERIKIYWAKSACSKSYSVRVSKDAKNWVTEFSNLNAEEGVSEGGLYSQTISLKRFIEPSRYVQIYVPVGSAATSNILKIADVEIYPAMNLAFRLQNVDSYAVGDNQAYVLFKTSIGAVGGEIVYGLDSKNLTRKASITEFGVINSAALTGLNPNRVYFYKVTAHDAFGRSVSSNIKTLSPKKRNIAKDKKVSGTFTALPPKDPYVTKGNVLSRVVDGKLSYFYGMATSQSVRNSAQYVTIDLGRTYPLKNAIIFWRALAYPEDFSVSISNDSRNWSSVAAKLNAALGAFGRSETGDPMRVVNVNLRRSARYIRVYVDKNSPCYQKHANWDFVQLMEVQVFND